MGMDEAWEVCWIAFEGAVWDEHVVCHGGSVPSKQPLLCLYALEQDPSFTAPPLYAHTMANTQPT